MINSRADYPTPSGVFFLCVWEHKSCQTKLRTFHAERLSIDGYVIKKWTRAGVWFFTELLMKDP